VSADELKALKSRKLVKEDTINSFRVTKGENFKPEFSKPVADISRAMLKDGSWANATFKSINFAAKGRPGIL
jgi:phenylalanyl-tRNA synthetase alpha subunit